MANRSEHLLIGAIAGGGLYLLFRHFREQQPTLGGLALAAVGGAVAGCVPDVLEPPLHPNHRGFFHSVGASAFTIYLARQISRDPNASSELKWMAMIVAAGYCSHAAVDSITPKGIRLL